MPNLSEKTGGKGVIAEADKMSAEWTDDRVGYVFAGNSPHLNHQPLNERRHECIFNLRCVKVCVLCDAGSFNF
jgi:hypothetical protein